MLQADKFGGDRENQTPDNLCMKEVFYQLNYITCYMVEDSGIEPLTQACKASVFPIRLIPQFLKYTGESGEHKLFLSADAQLRDQCILKMTYNLSYYTP